MCCFQVNIVILLYGLSHVGGFFHFSHRDHFISKNSASYGKSTLSNESKLWFEQRVDHFNESDQRTFPMKYIQCTDLWKPGGPIFLQVSGEVWVQAPCPMPRFDSDDWLMNQIVRETGAAYFQLDHRYYGESLPFHNPTTEQLVYHSSKQALADIALFLRSLKAKEMYKNSKVMVGGMSYPGSLAAWLKLLYPDLVDAVLSSSAPVLAKADFYEYYETATDTFAKYGSLDCVKKIKEKFDRIQQLLQSAEGIEKLKKEFNICEKTDMTVPKNQQVFLRREQVLNSFFAEVAYPQEIREYCQNLNFNHLPAELLPFTGSGCNDYDYNNYIKWMSSLPRFHLYQRCTEFGFFQTTTSSKQVFGNNTVPIDFFYDTCTDVFGEEFNEQRVKQGVSATNARYGGLTPNVSNVVFTNGDMDPWHNLGVLQDVSPDAPAIYITGSSHCTDASGPLPEDSESLKEARKRVKSLMKKWIGAA